MEFNCEQSYIYLHSQGLTNMWKAFPSPSMLNGYHDKYQYCMIREKNIVIFSFLFIFMEYFDKNIENACENTLMSCMYM